MKINYKNSSSQPKDYEYKCKSCSEIFTVQATMSEMKSEVDCECGSTATRYINQAPLFHLDPISGDHLIATSKWEKGRNKQMAKEKHNMENHGTYD